MAVLPLKSSTGMRAHIFLLLSGPKKLSCRVVMVYARGGLSPDSYIVSSYIDSIHSFYFIILGSTIYSTRELTKGPMKGEMVAVAAAKKWFWVR